MPVRRIGIKRQSGITAIGVTASLVVIITLVLITANAGAKLTKSAIRTAQIEEFQSDSFIAMQAYYYDYVNTTTRCYNVIPPPITPMQLVVKGMLDSRYLEANFFDSSSALLSYGANSTTGRVELMIISVAIPHYDARSLFNLPNTASITSNNIRFEQYFSRNNSNIVLQNMTSTHCQG
ncbi:hypothetical protein [Vibrio sp. 1180_3]|uniref:hypothetical protein n=1 Tax=Vibrio sp. 1180_3 TaxID=2528832 RepID=UPI002404F977|nr:hypothetical protein [Vibrio sp. 1180_3]MDF9399136.1 hypothetical protein [Vibrio sp. 1180_3]